MKKNGFTLIEILGVITLLSILSVIVLISVNKSLKDSVETLSSMQLENIKSAAAMWRTDHIDLVSDNDYYIVSLSELQSSGYIDNDIIDFKTEQAYSDDLLIEVGIDDVVVNDSLIKNGYKKLEYIESTGTQYIDTGVVANQNTGFDIDFIAFNKINNTTGEFGTIFGSRETYHDRGYQLTTYNNTTLLGHFLFGTNSLAANIRYSAGIISETRQQISFRNRVLTLPDNFTTQVDNYDFETPSTLTIFALHQQSIFGEYSKTRLYGFKLYDGDTLIRNFIPSLDKNNKAGLYDLVENKFYENDGTGDFVYKLPKDVLYTKLEYIESTGTQYIDTGVNATNRTVVKAKMFTNNGENKNWFGGSMSSQKNFILNSYSQNQLQYKYGLDNDWHIIDIGDNIVGTDFIVEYGNGHIKINDIKIVDLPSNIFTDTKTLQIFIRNGGGAYINGKIYYFQIYEGTTLIRNMIPCFRNSDNAIGLYDEVNDVFYENSGTGTFSYGELN